MHEANALSAYWFAIDKDCPGKTWWDCEPYHPAVGRALGITRADHGAPYAVAPFRLYKSDAGVRVLAAYPALNLFDEPDPDWLGIETVISWDPVRDVAEVMDDPAPQIVGAMTERANRLFSSPRAFFQQWAVRRAQFAVRRQEAAKGHWHIAPRESDEVPGGLVIGAAAEITWRPSALPENIECVGINPTVINRAILRAARLPRAVGGAQ